MRVAGHPRFLASLGMTGLRTGNEKGPLERMKVSVSWVLSRCLISWPVHGLVGLSWACLRAHHERTDIGDNLQMLYGQYDLWYTAR